MCNKNNAKVNATEDAKITTKYNGDKITYTYDIKQNILGTHKPSTKQNNAKTTPKPAVITQKKENKKKEKKVSKKKNGTRNLAKMQARRQTRKSTT